MTEKEIRDVIKDKLTESFFDANVTDFPLNIINYTPTHPRCEILIKSIGYIVNYIMRGNTADTTNWGDFALSEYRIRIDIIVTNELRSQDRIFEISDSIIKELSEIQFDGYTGRCYLTEAGEADFDMDKMFQFRDLIFTVPYVGFV